MGDVVQLHTDPLTRARALLAQDNDEFDEGLRRLRERDACRKALQGSPRPPEVPAEPSGMRVVHSEAPADTVRRRLET